jgi:predicted phage-related endonuclease
MRGDTKAIYNLWLEMTGQEFEYEDLSSVWPVQLGACTEALNLDWYERKSNSVITRRGEVVVHLRYPWAAVTLDGWIDDLNCPIEAKHVGGREPLEVIIERYWPQMGWQMEVTGADQCALSVIAGANAPVVEFIPRDDGYIAEMIARGEQFMEHVRNRTPPVVLDAVPAPIDPTRVYDMSDSNSWCNSASVWIETKPASDRCKDAEKILKNLCAPDCKKAFGGGVVITRDRVGRLSLRQAS